MRVPEIGFGRKLEEIYRWLDLETSRDNPAWTGDTIPGHHSPAIYLPIAEGTMTAKATLENGGNDGIRLHPQLANISVTSLSIEESHTNLVQV